MLGLLAAAAAVALLPVTVEAAPGGQPVTDAEPAVGVERADANRNRISDELDAKIADLGPTDTVQVIVMTDGPGSQARAADRVGPFVVDQHLPLIDGFSATVTSAQVRGLANSPGVERIQTNGVVSVSNDSAQADHGVLEAQAQYSVHGTGVGVCIVDTGLDPSHEQLDGGKIAGWLDVIGGQPLPYDDQGHGTHVAATAVGDGTGGPEAAALRGVAPGADLYGAKVLDATGIGDDAGIVVAIDWCANQPGVDIISMSLTTESSSDGLDAMSVAANNAVTVHGKTVVAAAGNRGDADETVGGPAAAELVVAVGASAEWSAPLASPQRSHGPYLAPFSSRGPTLDGRVKPDVVAPGVTIRSAQAGTTTGYVEISGTSMAAPFVAGVAALALEADPTLTPAQLKAILMDTARDLGPAGTDNQWGAGLVDGLAVVAAAGGDDRATPLPASTHLTGTVPDNGEWFHSFDLTPDAVGHPIALTLLIDGDFPCLLELLGICFLQDMEADLDVELRDPAGTLIDQSGCPLFTDCGTGGRQETLHLMPATAGTYELRVFPFADPLTGLAPGGSFEADLFVGPPESPVVSPGLWGIIEGDTGQATIDIPVTLQAPSAVPVSVAWQTVDLPGTTGVAISGQDYLAASGTLVFAPGQTESAVSITVLGDQVDEPDLLYGEWLIVQFLNPPTNATLDVSFFGLGVGVIIDDD
ncbi:MAG: S8 family serine peptidase [Acidimicrobiales bacterium]|nr:S8 family serine peptidase [Acidimicrobiales bacterium]